MLRFVFTLILLAHFTASFSQNDSLRVNDLTLYPILYYLPETGLGFGGAGIYTYRLSGESNSSRPSQVQTALSYTLKQQILLYLYGEVYKNDQKWWLRGELGYYRFFYDFFGVGNDNPSDYIETFGVTYPRARLNFQYLVAPNLYSGVQYWLDDYRITEVEAGKQLESGSILGGAGGVVSGLGWVTNYDTRDNIFVPSKGIFIEAIAFWNNEAIASDFNFSRYTIDATTYIATAPNQVLALNGYIGWVNGNAPFNELLFFGGRRRARGYYEGRFRDDHMMLLQAEYRFPLFWRFGMTVFGSYGGIAPSFTAYDLNNFKWNVGAGLRFKINQEGTNLRFDLGFGERATNFYFTVGEAF